MNQGHPDYSIVQIDQNTQEETRHSESSEKPSTNVSVKNSLGE